MDKIELSREEFAAVYAALQMANTPYADDDDTLAELVAKERTAWEIVQQVAVRHRTDPPASDPASGASPIS